MNSHAAEMPDAGFVASERSSSSSSLPWQIWIVIAFLAIEGINNLFAIPHNLEALIWLLAKCLFIAGLVRRWRWVYALCVAFGILHVAYFLMVAPAVALVNLALVLLQLSALRDYFPVRSVETNHNLTAHSARSII